MCIKLLALEGQLGIIFSIMHVASSAWITTTNLWELVHQYDSNNLTFNYGRIELALGNFSL